MLDERKKLPLTRLSSALCRTWPGSTSQAPKSGLPPTGSRGRWKSLPSPQLRLRSKRMRNPSFQGLRDWHGAEQGWPQHRPSAPSHTPTSPLRTPVVLPCGSSNRKCPDRISNGTRSVGNSPRRGPLRQWSRGTLTGRTPPIRLPGWRCVPTTYRLPARHPGLVIASFGYSEPPANAAHETYRTSAKLVGPFGYASGRFDAERGNTNSPLNLANLSDNDIEGNTHPRPSISDAHPEPLIPGAQYAQVVVQRNDAVLGNPRIDRTTERLLSVLAETVRSLGPGSGPISGSRHTLSSANRVRELNIPGIRTQGVEQSFSLGDVVRYGLDGSIRTDVVLRDRSGTPIAVYDLKTGNAKLSASRVQEIRDAVGVRDIPVIELRYRSENALLR